MADAAPPPAYAAPPPAAYPQHQTGPTVVVAQPMIQPMAAHLVFRETPVPMTCPYCNAQITTSLTYESGTLVWIIAGVLLLMGLWLGCCLIPFCIDGVKDVAHTCPNCRQRVGKFSRV